MGLDVGTTSTQMIVSRLRIENRASEFAVPDLVIADREILYESPVHFTPLRSEALVDGEALRTLLLEEYRHAGLTRETVDTGAVIVTGETSRKENAREVAQALSGLAGDFVVATAGPDLESELAARGSGAVAYSAETGKTVLHMDIGGGTANLCLIRGGEIAATGCLNVGGRLLKLDKLGAVTYVSPVLGGLWGLSPGSRPSQADIDALCARLAQALEAAAGLTQADALLRQLTTEGTRPLPLQNLRAVCLSPREQAALPAHLPEKLRAAEGQAIVALPGLPAPGYAQICALAEALLEAIPQGPVLVCLEEDQAKALGQAMACRTERPILCIDRVKPPRDSFLDIGPRAGAAYPLVVKTLVFGKEQQL